MTSPCIDDDLLGNHQVCCRGLAVPAGLKLKRDLLAFLKVCQTGGLDCRDVDEHIRGLVLRLDESVSFGGVKPLDCPNTHVSLL